MVRVDATVCAPGVYTYHEPGGKTVREYVPPEEIAKPESLASLEDATVTNRHPSSMVNPSTWGAVSIGHAKQGKLDGDKAVSTLVISRAEAQAELGKSLIEVSRGVNVRIDETPGVTPAGERYDRVQRDITYNHIALGPQGWGRQGSGVALRLDAAGDEIATSHEVTTPMKITTKDGKILEFKTDSECQAYFDGLSERADAAPPFPPKKKGEEDDEEEEKKKKAEKKDAEDKLAAERARADAATAELKAIRDREAQARKDSLVAQARTVLGAEYKTDEKTSDRDVHLAVLAKLKPEVKFDGRDDAYVKAYYDIAIEAPARSDSQQDTLLNQLYGVRQDGTRDDGKGERSDSAPRVDARTKMAQRDAEASKKPLGQGFFGK
jgi:hypothetical protein